MGRISSRNTLSKKRGRSKRRNTKKVYKGGAITTDGYLSRTDTLDREGVVKDFSKSMESIMNAFINVYNTPEVTNSIKTLKDMALKILSNPMLEKSTIKTLLNLKKDPLVQSAIVDIGLTTARLVVEQPQLMQVMQTFNTQYKLLSKPEVQAALGVYINSILPIITNTELTNAIVLELQYLFVECLKNEDIQNNVTKIAALSDSITQIPVVQQSVEAVSSGTPISIDTTLTSAATTTSADTTTSAATTTLPV